MPARKTGDKPTAPGAPITRTTIPGGSATWWKPDELPTYKEREIGIVSMQINKAKLKALSNAQDVIMDDEPVTQEQIDAGAFAVLSEGEARALTKLTDVAIWAYLKSWTLTELVDDATQDGKPIKVRVPIPLPESPDDVKYLPKNIFSALEKTANEIVTASNILNQGFEVNGDQESPTQG